MINANTFHQIQTNPSLFLATPLSKLKHDGCSISTFHNRIAHPSTSSLWFVVCFFSCPVYYILTFYPLARAENLDVSGDSNFAQSEADRAAEEEALEGVRKLAEDEEQEDGGDAMDEDADAARLHPDKHPLTNLPESASDVLVAHTFVTGGLKDGKSVLTLGEEVRVLVALANGGKSMYHVWGMMGSLNMAGKFSMYVQNFSYSSVNASVQSGEELSLQYSFKPNERLDTRKFQLALTMFYEAQSSDGSALRGHSTTFFNSTVDTLPGPQAVSNTVFLALVALFIAASFAAIAFLVSSSSDSTEKSVSSKQASSEQTESDWLEEHRNVLQSGGGRSKLTKRK